MIERLAPLASRMIAGALLLAALAVPARAADPDYSDIWWAAGGVEAGWGVNFAQGPGVIFVTFFIYGQDKQPVWYVSSMVQTGAGRYSGALYRVTGSWFGGGWVPSDATETLVGEAQFVAENVQRGVFTYRVDTTQVIKTIERLALTPIPLAGVYIGGMLIKSSSQCSGGASSVPYAYQLLVTEPSQGVVRIEQVSLGGATDCTMQGNATQLGRTFRAPAMSYVCQFGVDTQANVSDLRRTSNGGIELAWTANLGNGCTETGTFSGVPQQ